MEMISSFEKVRPDTVMGRGEESAFCME